MRKVLLLLGLMSWIQGQAQNHNIAMKVELESADFITRKVSVVLKASNQDQVPINMGSSSIRLTYDHMVYSNPTITFTGSVFPHTISEQALSGTTITSYGILAITGGHQLLPVGGQWVIFGRFSLDMAPTVGPSSSINIDFERGAGISPTPTVLQEFITMNNQPELNIIEFQDLGGVLSVLTTTQTLGVPGISLSCYPNPTVESITLRVDGAENGVYRYLLSDINGKLVEQSQLNQAETRVVLPSTGAYILQLLGEGGQAVAQQRLLRCD